MVAVCDIPGAVRGRAPFTAHRRQQAGGPRLSTGPMNPTEGAPLFRALCERVGASSIAVFKDTLEQFPHANRSGSEFE